MSTHLLSQQQLALSCHMQTQIRQAIDATGQQAVANCIGIDTTAITKMKSAQGTAKHGDIERICHLLAVCGLKIVPVNTKNYDAEKIEILFRTTKDYFQRLEGVDDFFQNNDVRFSRTDSLPELSPTRNLLLELLLRCVDAGKNLISFNVDRSETARLVARQQIEIERLQEIKDKVSDEALLWKLIYVVIHVIAAIWALSITYKIWG